MPLALLTLNSGSSSLKFSLFSVSNNQLQRVFYGQIENLAEQPKFWVKNNKEERVVEQLLTTEEKLALDPQTAALSSVLDWLKKQNSDYRLFAVGHRVVHGGGRFTAPVVITPQVVTQLEAFSPLAPLHQPYNLAGIKALAKSSPDVVQVACFDTEFHATQPEVAQAYALPEDLSPIAIKRYGFHGLSYEYIAQVAPHYLGNKLAEGRLILAHLGGGASLCGLRNRQSIATTMGFTPLGGLPMGTRCGDIDPGILLYLLQSGLSTATLTELLYNQSGLLGISKISGDVRGLLASTQPSAKKALAVFIYRMNRELGSLVAALGGLDSLIFTAGIGENSPEIRSRLCEQADWLSIKVEDEANQRNATKISHKDSKISVWVIPTNEELVIAQHTLNLVWRK